MLVLALPVLQNRAWALLLHSFSGRGLFDNPTRPEQGLVPTPKTPKALNPKMLWGARLHATHNNMPLK